MSDSYYLIGRIIAANFLQGFVLVRSEAGSGGGELLGYFDGVVAVVDGDVSHLDYLLLSGALPLFFILKVCSLRCGYIINPGRFEPVV